MPSVPMPMPSVTVGTPKTCGMAPDDFSAATARSTKGCIPALQGFMVEWPLATPTMGLSKSPSPNPTARSIARLGERATPCVIRRERQLSAMTASGGSLLLQFKGTPSAPPIRLRETVAWGRIVAPGAGPSPAGQQSNPRPVAAFDWQYLALCRPQMVLQRNGEFGQPPTTQLRLADIWTERSKAAGVALLTYNRSRLTV